MADGNSKSENVDFDALFASIGTPEKKVDNKVRGNPAPVPREVAEAPAIIDDPEDVNEVQVESESVAEAKFEDITEITIPEGTITEKDADEWKGEVTIKRVPPIDGPLLDPTIDPAEEPYPIDAIYDVTIQVIDKELMGKDEIINQLESGNIPIDIDERGYVKWDTMPDTAESVLMRILEIKEELDVQERVQDIIESQCDTAAGKMAVALYARLVDYDEDLLEPILKLDSFYFSALEDTDIMEVTFKAKQLELLESIDEKLEKLLDK
jgi:hypothetical protein